MSTQSKRAKGLENRHKTLHLLSRLGYATTRQIARGVFGKVTESTRKMATRTLNMLLADGLLVERRSNINSERMVALNEAGVKKLVSIMDFGLANNRPHARDWLRHAHDHRTAANSVFVAGSVYDYEPTLKFNDWHGSTELEIRLSDPQLLREARCDYRSSVEKTNVEHKIADAVFNHQEGDIWVEVEHSSRGTRDMTKCIDWLRAMYSMREPNAAEVWFVITSPGANRIGERLKKALTPGDFVNDARPRREKELDLHILQKRIKVFLLNHDTLEMTRIEI